MPATLVRAHQFFARVAHRTGLAGELHTRKRTLAPLVSALGGIRADRLDEACLVLAGRWPDFTPRTLLRELQEKHSLARTWGVRGVLQIVATPELAEYLAAAGASPRWRKFLDTRSPLTPEARLRLLKRLCPVDISRDALREGFPDAAVRMFLLREAAQGGHILWKDGDGPTATFGWSRDMLGHALHPTRDYHTLVARYLASYGPLGAADLGAWLGVTVAAARQLMAKHRVVEVQVEGDEGTTFIRPEELEELTSTRHTLARGHIVVPPGDPLVVAYKTRWRDPEVDDAPGLVFVEGRVVARWTTDRATAVVRVLDPAERTHSLKAVRSLLARAGWETPVVDAEA